MRSRKTKLAKLHLASFHLNSKFVPLVVLVALLLTMVPMPAEAAGDAEYFKVTGDTTMTAGGSNNITITAYDGSGNVATGYGGDKTLTFSGANPSPNPRTPPPAQIRMG